MVCVRSPERSHGTESPKNFSVLEDHWIGLQILKTQRGAKKQSMDIHGLFGFDGLVFRTSSEVLWAASQCGVPCDALTQACPCRREFSPQRPQSHSIGISTQLKLLVGTRPQLDKVDTMVVLKAFSHWWAHKGFRHHSHLGNA